MISSGAEAADRKQRIRDRYKGVDTSELEVIPAKTVEGLGESTSIRRVAAYVRVSTQAGSPLPAYWPLAPEMALIALAIWGSLSTVKS